MKCKKHPRYRAIYKPRINCRGCWMVYFQVRGLLFIIDLPIESDTPLCDTSVAMVEAEVF